MVVIGKPILGEMRLCSRFMDKFSDRVLGSGTLVRSLLEDDFLDELRLMVHPVVLGRGKRLFEEGSDQKRLELVDSKAFSIGILYLTYRPAHS